MLEGARFRTLFRGVHICADVALSLPVWLEAARRVASAAHCFASACAELDLVDAVTAGDWLVHRRLVSREELVQYAGKYTGAGAARARQAAGHVRERVESPRETHVRLLLVEYDGRQHADDIVQWNRDLDRLDHFEDARWGHVRVAAKRLERPREVARRVHAKLVARGDPGPAPVFGPQWVALFEMRSARQRARGAPTVATWSPSGRIDVTALAAVTSN